MALDDQVTSFPNKGKKAKTPSNKKDKIVVNPKISDNINEEKEPTAVMAFGRFNPPTVGHEKLLHKVDSVAKEHKASAHVFASHSEHTTKDPLPQDKKIGLLKKVVSKDTSVHGSTKDEPSFLHAAKKLHQAGHKHLVMIAGSDRVDEFKNRLEKYNGKEGHYNFKSIKVISSGDRDPDAEGVEGMSGTKMRDLARQGKHEEFKAGLPKPLHPHAKEIADHIRSVKEETDTLDERVADINLRRKRSFTMMRMQSKLQRARALARSRLASTSQLTRRAYKQAKNMIRKRFAGPRSASYAEMNPSDRVIIDRQIDPKVKLIKNLVKRIIPNIKQSEINRVQAVRHHKRPPKRKMPLVMSLDVNDLFSNAFNLHETISYDIFEKIYNLVESQSASASDINALFNKSIESKVPLTVISEVYVRGVQDWEVSRPSNKTAQQWAFDRVNSFINGGRAAEVDYDLVNENLRQWFQDKWVRMDTKGNIKGQCAKAPGEGKPKCLPLAKARAMDKEDRAAAVQRKRREDPNPDRSGPAINVATEEKDACYHKVKARYKVWPSAYASGALSKCRKSGADNWGNKSEEVQIDEISKDTKMRYVAKAAASTNEPKDGEKQSEYLERLHKRMSGIKKALSSTSPSQRFQKEEHGAGDEGTDKLVKKYKDDTPGQNESVNIPDDTKNRLKKITKQLDKSSVVHHKQSIALKNLIAKDSNDVKEEKNCGCNQSPCITYGAKSENFMDGKNPEDKGDMSRHGLKGKTIAQLKNVRSSDSASPRAKQLAHWYINMQKGKK